EERSAKAVEAMGREVLRIAQNLNGRVGQIEADAPARLEKLGETLTRKVETDMGRFAQGLEQRLVAADDRHAVAHEKLGGEITRMSGRLSERIAQSERRSQQALEDIGRRLVDSSSRIEQHYDRASGELAERMRLSEERTAALIAEARQNIGRRAEPAPAPAPSADLAQPDWRAAAFPDAAFPDAPFAEPAFADAGYDDPVFAEQQAWSADLAPPDPEPEPRARGEVLTADTVFDAVMRGPAADAAPSAPFGSRMPEASLAEELGPVPQAAPAQPQSFAQSAPAVQPSFGQGFGGADVSDALAATAPQAFDAGHEDFAGETDFVDPRALRAAAAQGRASSTRQAIDAARAAMAAPEEPPARSGFGLKRGGKSKLQERLDKQASKGGDTVRKALGASAVAVLLTAGGAAAFGELTGAGLNIPGMGGLTPDPEAQPIAALAATPADATPLDPARGAELYQQSLERIDADDATGIDLLKQAASLGHAPAQLHLAGLYQEGAAGLTASPREARVWARRAADSGDARGMHAYGMYLFDGVGGAQDRAEALNWLRKAAESGLVDSQFNVAKLYETGDEGIQPDLSEAYKWYLIAARAGDGDAQAAVERLRAGMPASERGSARAAADAFQVEPLA
ncbi:tetratricopeptide repeat protein, partial [Brevundimonas sp.]|uniref:tetratricopeptide repeat protein n=1 Tax=Brevundimonas sp. TaxID=1871086 RepID=UPI002ED97D68